MSNSILRDKAKDFAILLNSEIKIILFSTYEKHHNKL